MSLGLGIGGGERGKRLQTEKGRGSLEGAFRDMQRAPSQLFGTELLVVWLLASQRGTAGIEMSALTFPSSVTLWTLLQCLFLLL